MTLHQGNLFLSHNLNPEKGLVGCVQQEKKRIKGLGGLDVTDTDTLEFASLGNY